MAQDPLLAQSFMKYNCVKIIAGAIEELDNLKECQAITNKNAL